MAKTVTVYTKPDCVQCDSTKTLFKNLGVAYQEVDLTQDAQALRTVKEAGFRSAPVVIANGEAWSGFNEEKIRAYAAA